LPRAGFNAPPAETSTPRKRSAVWCASLLANDMKQKGVDKTVQNL